MELKNNIINSLEPKKRTVSEINIKYSYCFIVCMIEVIEMNTYKMNIPSRSEDSLDELLARADDNLDLVQVIPSASLKKKSDSKESAYFADVDRYVIRSEGSKTLKSSQHIKNVDVTKKRQIPAGIGPGTFLDMHIIDGDIYVDTKEYSASKLAVSEIYRRKGEVMIISSRNLNGTMKLLSKYLEGSNPEKIDDIIDKSERFIKHYSAVKGFDLECNIHYLKKINGGTLK